MRKLIFRDLKLGISIFETRVPGEPSEIQVKSKRLKISQEFTKPIKELGSKRFAYIPISNQFGRLKTA